MEHLYRRIWRTPILKDFEKNNANDALMKVLSPEGLEVPTPSEMKLLERVFGPEMRRTLEDINKSLGRKVWDTVVDVSGISRALKSSWDVSALFRQGAVLTFAHPRRALRSTGRMFRSLVSEGAHQESLSRIRSDPDFDFIAGAGVKKDPLFIADAAETNLVQREEAFFSRLASVLPGVKQSQRAFNTYLNEMKWGQMKHYLRSLRREGIDPQTEGQRGVQTMSRFLNVATGRGTLGRLERGRPGSLEQTVMEVMQMGFWSPRLAASRFQLPFLPFALDW